MASSWRATGSGSAEAPATVGRTYKVTFVRATFPSTGGSATLVLKFGGVSVWDGSVSGFKHAELLRSAASGEAVRAECTGAAILMAGHYTGVEEGELVFT
jgi:hypothetical protein